MAEPPGTCGAGRFCYAYAACWADGLLCGVAAPRVLRASRVLSGGPGCLVCSWAAVFLLVVCCPDRSPAAARPARPLRPSAPRASLGASARCPAGPRRPRGGLQSVGVSVCCPAGPRRRPRAPQPGSPTCCLLPRWCSGRRMARPPARLGGLTSFVAAPRSPPVPSGPSGALRTGGACRCVLSGRSPRRPRVPRPGPPAPRPGAVACSASHPGYRALITEPTANFACNSPTILSNFEIRLLELQCFQALLKLHPIELRASFLGSGRMGVAGGVAGSREPGVWLSGTGVAFACLCPCGVETVIAFAGW